MPAQGTFLPKNKEIDYSRRNVRATYSCVVVFVNVLYVKIIGAKVKHITLVVRLHILIMAECP